MVYAVNKAKLDCKENFVRTPKGDGATFKNVALQIYSMDFIATYLLSACRTFILV
jgi:hypothetical protein